MRTVIELAEGLEAAADQLVGGVEKGDAGLMREAAEALRAFVVAVPAGDQGGMVEPVAPVKPRKKGK